MAPLSVRKAPHSPMATKTLKRALLSSRTFLKADATLILVCGRQPNAVSPGGRDLIMDYARKHLGKFQFFLAEKVFDLLGSDEVDLLSLEEHLLDYCDCVLLVLESESTFAELGAFAIKKSLAKNMLVINDVAFRNHHSFISLGPLAKVEKVSRFRPMIHVDLRSILRATPELVDRLSRIERRNNKRVSLDDAEKFRQLPSRTRMLFILDLISIFQPLARREIFDLLAYFYGENRFNIKLDLHLLEALGLAVTCKGYYLRNTDSQRLFFLYHGVDTMAVRSDVVNHYHKYARDRVQCLGKRGGTVA